MTDHKFAISYRGVKVPDELTNNLDRAEAYWFRKGVDAAIDDAKTTGFLLYGGFTPAQHAAMFAATNPFAASGPKYRYFRARCRSRATGQYRYWRIADGAAESYSAVLGRWERSGLSLAALRAADGMREVATREVPVHVQNAAKPGESNSGGPKYRYFKSVSGNLRYWRALSTGAELYVEDGHGWSRSYRTLSDLGAEARRGHIREVFPREVPERVRNA